MNIVVSTTGRAVDLKLLHSARCGSTVVGAAAIHVAAAIVVVVVVRVSVTPSIAIAAAASTGAIRCVGAIPNRSRSGCQGKRRVAAADGGGCRDRSRSYKRRIAAPGTITNRYTRQCFTERIHGIVP